jgi:hypothetical protein
MFPQPVDCAPVLRGKSAAEGPMSPAAIHAQERQVAMLLNSMGARSEDIFTSFQLTDEEAKTYDTIVTKFDNHFIGKRNVIFERVQFNRRIQNDGEDAETFITALHKLSENSAHCETNSSETESW